MFFFSTREKQFLKLGLYTLNTMQSLFFLLTLLLFKKHLTQIVTLEKKLFILSHSLSSCSKTNMSKGCQQLIANLRAFRSLVAGLSSTSSFVSSFSSRSGGSVRSSNMNSSFSSHHVQRRSYGGATPKGSSYFSEGTQTKRNGLLFGETPPLKGQKRIRESWELPYFVTFFSAGVILCVGLNGKPDTSLVGWAKEEARKRLEKEEEDER